MEKLFRTTQQMNYIIQAGDQSVYMISSLLWMFIDRIFKATMKENRFERLPTGLAQTDFPLGAPGKQTISVQMDGRTNRMMRIALYISTRSQDIDRLIWFSVGLFWTSRQSPTPQGTFTLFSANLAVCEGNRELDHHRSELRRCQRSNNWKSAVEWKIRPHSYVQCRDVADPRGTHNSVPEVLTVWSRDFVVDNVAMISYRSVYSLWIRSQQQAV